MVDVTQSMACIQCGACVSDCLSMEVDPLFVGPAALAKAYRFVGDPRDGQHARAPQGPRRGPARDLRLHPLLQLHRGLPEGRGADEPDHAPAPRSPAPTTTSTTATTATATRRRSSSNIRKNGLLHEADLLPRLLRRQVPLRAPVPELLDSLPVITKALLRGKVTPAKALLHHKHPKALEGGASGSSTTVEGKRGARRAEPVHHRRRGRRRDRGRGGREADA